MTHASAYRRSTSPYGLGSATTGARHPTTSIRQHQPDKTTDAKWGHFKPSRRGQRKPSFSPGRFFRSYCCMNGPSSATRRFLRRFTRAFSAQVVAAATVRVRHLRFRTSRPRPAKAERSAGRSPRRVARARHAARPHPVTLGRVRRHRRTPTQARRATDTTLAACRPGLSQEGALARAGSRAASGGCPGEDRGADGSSAEERAKQTTDDDSSSQQRDGCGCAYDGRHPSQCADRHGGAQRNLCRAKRAIQHVCRRSWSHADERATRGARDSGDAVAGGDQLTDGSPPDDAGGSGDDDVVHVELTTDRAGS